MRVLHISTRDVSGGAARAAYRIHRGLAEEGLTSKMLVGQKTSNDPAVFEGTTRPQQSGWFRNRLRQKQLARYESDSAQFQCGDWDYFSTCLTRTGVDVSRWMNNVDVVHLHWISGFVDLDSFTRTVAGVKPIVWTLHDMNAFTGGCHYDAQCGRYRESCGTCPALGSQNRSDISNSILDEKKKLFRKVKVDQCRIVGDSHWLTGCARESSLLSRFRASTIHYGLDHNIFKPGCQKVSRQHFGIPADACVLAFCAEYVQNTRKGLSLLVEAIGRLREEIPKLFLLIIGNANSDIQFDTPHKFTGPITDDSVLAAAYRCADLFVIPSKQEAFGQVTLEAMACGVPGVGFAVGGIVDLIKPGANGLLAAEVSATELACTIRTLLLDSALNRQCAAGARTTVEADHTLQHQARKYINLYHELLSV